MSLTGGTCSVVDGYTYVQAGDVGGKFMTVSFKREGNVASDPGLGWQTDPNHAAGSSQGTLTVTLDPVGTSGTFRGSGAVALAGEQPRREPCVTLPTN